MEFMCACTVLWVNVCKGVAFWVLWCRPNWPISPCRKHCWPHCAYSQWWTEKLACRWGISVCICCTESHAMQTKVPTSKLFVKHYCNITNCIHIRMYIVQPLQKPLRSLSSQQLIHYCLLLDTHQSCCHCICGLIICLPETCVGTYLCQ